MMKGVVQKITLLTAVTTFSAIIYTGYMFWRYRKEEDKLRQTRLEWWNKSIFFPDFYPERPDSPFQQFLSCLREAKKMLRICVMTIFYKEIIDFLKEKHRQGVKVLVYTSANSSKKLKREFRTIGIEIRSKKTEYKTQMHHKFAIIDNEAVMTGSLNWTSLSVTRQQENVLVTSNPSIVSKFCDEFEKVWNNYNQD